MRLCQVEDPDDLGKRLLMYQITLGAIGLVLLSLLCVLSAAYVVRTRKWVPLLKIVFNKKRLLVRVSKFCDKLSTILLYFD